MIAFGMNRARTAGRSSGWPPRYRVRLSRAAFPCEARFADLSLSPSLQRRARRRKAARERRTLYTLPMLPRRVTLLDARPTAIAALDPLRDAVNIPATEIHSRRHELPRPGEPLDIFDPTGSVSLDRPYFKVTSPERGPAGRARLWNAHDWLPDGRGTAIDLGCGAGRDAVALACLGWDVIAIDNLPTSIEMARDLERRYSDGTPIDWQVRDLRNDSPAGYFDLIIAFFFWKPEAILQTSQNLNLGGRLLIEMFTPTDQAKHGKPKHVTDSDQLRSLFSHLKEEAIEEDWRNGRHTVRAAFTCP